MDGHHGGGASTCWPAVTPVEVLVLVGELRGVVLHRHRRGRAAAMIGAGRQRTTTDAIQCQL
jgi:hypothetical protein